MKAIVTRRMPNQQREKVLVDDWPDLPAPIGNQVKTRTLYSGVTNGTERNDLICGNYAHKDEQLPAGWGYQNVGEVVEVGPQVQQLKMGDVLYMSQDHMEYCICAEDGLLVKLPSEIDPKHAALFGMSSVAMRSCRHADLKMGQQLLIVGAGFIGQVGAQIARVMGARVTLCDVDDRRLAIARQIGAAEEVINVAGEGWKENIKDFSFDAVLDVAGVKGMENQLIAATKSRGIILFIAGRFQVDYDFNLGQRHEITICQNSHFDNDDLANLCRLVRLGIVRIGPLIQDVIPINQAKRIYDTLRDTPNKLFGTVFDWNM